MQGYRDNEQNLNKMATSRSFWILYRSAKFGTGYPCVIPYIFLFHCPAIFCIVFRLLKCLEMTKIQNGRKAAILKLSASKS